MKIAHRKFVFARDKAWWDFFVNLFSGCGGFAHSELVFDNGESFSSTTDFDAHTLVYPTARDAHHLGRTSGPIIRKIKFPDWEWQFTELDLTDSQKLQIYNWCIETIDQSIKDQAGYDYAGVLRFVCKWLKQSPRNWFCSEAVVAALQHGIRNAGMQEKTPQELPAPLLFLHAPRLRAWTISPNRLFDLCHQFAPLLGGVRGGLRCFVAFVSFCFIFSAPASTPPLPPGCTPPAKAVKVKKAKAAKPLMAMTPKELAHWTLSRPQRPEMTAWARDILSRHRVHVPRRAVAAPKDFRR
jgi:hypothetical protein